MSEYVNRRGSALGALQSGSHGSTVVALQKKLITLGFKVTADGSYGPATRAAVVVMQKGGGATVDGVAGPQTMGIIDAAVAGDARDLTASAKGPTRVNSRKAARERSRLREMQDAKQAQLDADFAATRAAAMAKAPAVRTGGTTRTAFWAQHTAEQAAAKQALEAKRSGVPVPGMPALSMRSKMPLVIGGIAAVGLLGYALTFKKKGKK